MQPHKDKEIEVEDIVQFKSGGQSVTGTVKRISRFLGIFWTVYLLEYTRYDMDYDHRSSRIMWVNYWNIYYKR